MGRHHTHTTSTSLGEEQRGRGHRAVNRTTPIFAASILDIFSISYTPAGSNLFMSNHGLANCSIQVSNLSRVKIRKIEQLFSVLYRL